MVLLIRLAWRNIRRNTRRTILAGLAIGVGLASLIFTDALMIGMNESMVRTATDTFLGHGQIHAQDFRANMEIERTIVDLEAVVASLKREEGLRHFALRTQAFAMLTSPANVGAVALFGIDAAGEMGVSKIDEAIVQGAYLQAGDRRMLIGSNLAQTLEVEPGDRVVVTVAQAESGELAQEMFRIGGVFHFNVREMDGRMAFIDLGRAQELLGLEGRVHQIALHFDAMERDMHFWQRYSQAGNEALGWRQLIPELDAVLGMSQYSMAFMELILFGVVALSVMNTLFMSFYERLFEFGVLRAMGTRPARLAALVLLEAAGLSLVSVLIGVALGAAFTGWVAVTGIDYRGIEVGGVTFRELIYPVLSARQFIVFPLQVFIFALIAGVYPAVYAARLMPAAAMRESF
jgi:ABC-type lipoprotein release transport system permease subunit